jgi:hypothetical protein
MVKLKMKELVGHGQICVNGGTHLILARMHGNLMEIL